MSIVDEIVAAVAKKKSIGDMKSVVALYRKLVAFLPENAGILNEFGKSIIQQEGYEAATQVFLMVYRIDPFNYISIYNYSMALLRCGRYDDSIEIMHSNSNIVSGNKALEKLLAHANYLKSISIGSSVVNDIESKLDVFATFHFRPSRANFFGVLPDVKTGKSIAIIMQGPLLKKDEFTLETVRLYRKIFPDSTLVISTWKGEDQSVINDLRKSGAEIILNDIPQSSGPIKNGKDKCNNNMQIRTASSGISWAAENRFEYCFKTRTDFRIHNPSFFVDSINILGAFPLKKVKTQKERLVVFSGIVKYVPYVINDQQMFGCVDDMLAYWAPPEDRRDAVDFHSMSEWAQQRVGEAWFLTHFLEKIGHKIEWNMDDSWSAIRDYFVVIDQQSQDVYWRKYRHYLEYPWKNYGEPTTFEDFRFADWLRLYMGRYPIPKDDRIFERDGGVPIGDLLAGC